MRIWHLAIAILTGVTLLAPTLAAAQGDVYTVSGIEVSGTGQTVGEARDRALQEGRRQALRVIAGELAPGREASIAPLTPAESRSLIAEETLTGERTTNSSYRAVMTIRFSGPAARQYFGGGGSASAAQTAAQTAAQSAPQTAAPAAIPPAAPGSAAAAAAAGPSPLAATRPDPAGTYRAFVPLTNIHDWNDVLSRLRQVPGVEGVSAISLSRGAGVLRFTFGGALPDLQEALRASDLALTSETTGSAPAPWRLELTTPIVPPAG